MDEQILKTINKYELIKSGDKIVLAVSGGPDSIFMLDILIKLRKKINYNIVVCHINHMIRKEAEADEIFVKNFCAKYNIECFIKRIDVREYANNNKIGTEEAGRIVRYEFFEEILKKTHSNKIALAHNKNDKVETILMNILRGTGIQGLKGIEPIRDNKYIRPIIEIERKDIEKYCRDNNLNPRIDKTNFENIYTRNKIRNVVIPYIQKEFNPSIVESINRLSQIATEEDDFLNAYTKEIYKNIIIEEKKNQIILNLKELNKQDRVIKKRIILYTINNLFGSNNGIEKIHIEDVLKLCEKNIGNKYLTPNKNIKILVNKGKVFFIVTKNY
ncbi:MAG: tRNA lysidine(34) synthetase TilS [Clostridia bacterium]|nr:tRNA lysidine(34) synthetase TilS [Clostridia bacterium]